MRDTSLIAGLDGGAGHATKSCSPKGISLMVLPSANGIGEKKSGSNNSGPQNSGPLNTSPKVHRKVRMGRRRAFVLILVHVLILIHVAQWLLSGMNDGIRETISPIEPSESMYTLEGGYVNAGFIFFVLAILSTLIFGRFFCGWGCHVVALQDLCSHWMKKIGVHPKPFRARLLVFAPMCLAIYMFVWPTVLRLSFTAFERFAPQVGITRNDWPSWLPPVSQLAGFSNHLIVEDFWRTFPPWYVAIPFLFVCGFAMVYFLGSKGFCTYGCPYGGLFGPADLVSIGKIKVNDNCNGCGHCTAVCTSNVRVHQEVRDYGKVIDPGCMKCLDCVSVCPNDALSFGIAAPTIFTKGRTEAAKKKKTQRPPYDLTWGQEFIVTLLALLLFMSFRGMFNSVPMLMAVAMGVIVAFSAWKLGRMFYTPNVRLQSIQLAFRGKWTSKGYLFAFFTVVMLAMGAWSGVIRAGFVLGNYYDHKVSVGLDQVFSRGYVPDKVQKQLALSAISNFERGGPFSDGGIGWKQAGERPIRLAWLHAVAGNLPEAERYLRLAMLQGPPTGETVDFLGQIIILQNKKINDVRTAFAEVLEKNLQAHEVRLRVARIDVQLGKIDAAVANAKYLVELKRPAPPGVTSQAAMIAVSLGKSEEIRAAMLRDVERRPKAAPLRLAYAQVLYAANDKNGALEQMRLAVELAPMSVQYRQLFASLLMENGKNDEAIAQMAEIDRINQELAEMQARGEPFQAPLEEAPQGSQSRP